MRSSGLGRASSVFNIAKSAKDSIGRVASETRGANIFEMFRSKAHNLSVAADGATRRAPSARRNCAPKTQTQSERSSDGSDLVDDARVRQMCDMGFSNAAARLALAKSRGQLAIACNFLCDEANLAEIEAAEAADLDGTIEWFRARSSAADGDPSEEIPEPEASYSGCPLSDGRETAVSNFESERGSDYCQDSRRQSLRSDDGCGLGRFLNRESFPSPRQVPFPDRLSRGTRDSLRRCSVSSAGSRVSNASDCADSECEEFDRRSDSGRPDFTCSDMGTDDSEKLLPPREHSRIQEGDARPQNAPLPPDSACWDWPLSRHEKKTRVHMIERQIFDMDRSTLLKEVDELRKSRNSGASQTYSLSRPST